MNPDVQARLLAFQAKRQQKMQQHLKQTDKALFSVGLTKSSSADFPSQSYPLASPNLASSSTSDVLLPPSDTGKRSSLHDFGDVNSGLLDSDDALNSGSDSDSGLIRRTSFRLPKKKGDGGGDSKAFPPSGHASPSSVSPLLNRSFGSPSSSSVVSPLASTPTGEYFDRFKNPDATSHRNISGSAVSTTATDANSIATSSSTPSTPSSQSGKPKRTLSERRGMNLNLGSLHLSDDKPQRPQLTPKTSITPGRTVPAPPFLGMDRSRQSALPRRAPVSSASLSSVTTNSTDSSSGSVSGLSFQKSPYKPQGLFAPFARYVDIKSGSLNFAGKASVHSKGIDFSNGSSFRISMDDLEVLGELGRGNYGVVSKVLHKPTGVIMAMKEVRLELDDSKFQQILMELEVLHSCNSDCIVDFYGAFFVEGAVYMCIECMQGGSLDRIYGDGIPELELRYITKQVVKGLKQLKDEHNIIHRDVKPTNMLVNDAGKVKLCDFGVSGNLVASLARTNIGCQSYMAPERIKIANPDASTYSVQSDVWSLGLSLLEIAKGCYPYPPDTYSNIFSQLSAIVDGQPPELPEGRFSEQARIFVKRCLSKNPDDRPTYSELLEDPWLKNADVLEGQKRLAEIVRKKLAEKKDNVGERKSKRTPALHRVDLKNLGE
ncbi:DEKNAAC102894 [Brettanomyces naardenensis]|uniref:mitogen-activated protein kinase kinase n=1 Tax=Brettanomyces naardenensis TaxID=13370 RepID=A0A448YM09_BRENA|nr:DEKNAAC102894 [Brettanomyces naardenensis]